MSEAVHTFSDEQLRVIANLEQHYDAWLDAERAVRRLPYGMHWKTVSGRDYLYRVQDRAGNANSLGPRSDATDAEYERYRAEKQDLKDRIDGARSKLLDDSRLYRALRLPRIASAAAAILREDASGTRRIRQTISIWPGFRKRAKAPTGRYGRCCMRWTRPTP